MKWFHIPKRYDLRKKSTLKCTVINLSASIPIKENLEVYFEVYLKRFEGFHTKAALYIKFRKCYCLFIGGQHMFLNLMFSNDLSWDSHLGIHSTVVAFLASWSNILGASWLYLSLCLKSVLSVEMIPTRSQILWGLWIRNTYALKLWSQLL